MSTVGLTEPSAEDLRDALESVLVPHLTDLLSARAAGHCMRVTEVDAALAARLVRRLRGANGTGAEVHLLGPTQDTEEVSELRDVTVTSTKLVELRNRTEQPREAAGFGPLLVFVPPGLRASVEDSFGVATFEEVSLGGSYDLLAARLLDEVPATLRPSVEELLAVLGEGSDQRASARARVAYLLTLKANGYGRQAAGAAVFHFALVPDFELFAQPGEMRERAARNRVLVDKLTESTRSERQRVLELKLIDAEFASRLAEFAVRCGLEDRVAWTRRIVVDRENWPLSFGNWRLDDRRRTPVSIEVQDLELPRAGDVLDDLAIYPALSAVAGQPYLLGGSKGITEVIARFTVRPDPRKVDGLVRFRVEIVSENSGPIGRSAHASVGKTAKAEYKAALRKLTKIDWDEGWHYVSVTPLDDQAQPLDVESRIDGMSGGESERFYVVPDAETEDPPERKVGRYEGVVQALRDLQFQALGNGDDATRVALGEVRWKVGSGRAQQRTLSARLSAAGQVDIRLSPVLTDLQQRILAAADRPGLWQLSLGPADTGHPMLDADDGLVASLTGRSAEAFEAFLAARRAYFSALRGTDDPTEDENLLVTEALDFSTVRSELAAYVEAYTELIAAQMHLLERSTDEGRAPILVRLAQLLQIDCVATTLTDGLGQRHHVLLASPTHPLRALWLATWSALGADWITGLAGADQHQIIAARSSLLDELSSLGFPFAVPRRDGRLLVASENLTPYWGAYLPSEVEDPRGLLDQLVAALRLPATTSNTGVGATGLSGGHLADRVERYVRLHPYVHTLVMNVVNAGRGELLADMLLELQRREVTRPLRFDLRLCVSDPEAPEVGEALAELLRTEAQVSAAEAEAFLNPSGGTLQAKLAFSVRAVNEFTANPGDFDAHLTVLIDAFGGEQLGSAQHQGIAHAPVHGLVQAMASQYVENEQHVAWRKFPRHGEAPVLDDAEDLTTLLGHLPALMASAAAAVATAGHTPRHVPCTVLALDTADRALLYQAHQVSDWVVTVDRTLGLEYFDHSAGEGRPEYVIDYVPQAASTLGHQIMVSSKSVDELRALLGPVAQDQDLDVDQRHLRTFFDQLRLLSGNLAFKLASVSPTQRTEVLGLSLARLYLDYQGVLTNQIIVPLDAHPELYSEVRRQVRELGDSLSFHRSDLALFHLDEQHKTITCRLVEVKCYTALNGVGAYQQLKTKIAEQLERSQDVLTTAFDPHHCTPDRVDRSVKNLALSSMLRFYLTRAFRHGTMAKAPYEAAHRVLDCLDDGYTLQFTRSGLIFDLARAGTDSELDHAVEYHRIGRDLIKELIEAIPTVQSKAQPHPQHPGPSDDAPAGPDNDQRTTLSQLELTVPRIVDAAFRAPKAEDVPASVITDQETSAARDLVEMTSGETSTDNPSSGSQQPFTSATLSEPSQQEGRSDPGASPMVLGGAAFHAPPPDDAPREVPACVPDAFLGVMRPSPQYGILGDIGARTVALDLNETHTISLFGVQGGGKSYTLGTIMEMASVPVPPVNDLPHPLATVVFHYSQTQDYAPEFTSMAQPNDDESQLRTLWERYGTQPKALEDVLLLVPAAQLAERRAEYPGVEVQPLTFASNELQAGQWRFLMGAVGNQSVYIRQLTRIMRANRDNLNLETIRQGVEDSELPDNLKRLARERLNLAAEYIDDATRLTDLIRPGRMIIVDLRDEFIEKDEALGLFVVLMQLFAEARDGSEHFNKLVVFDEAHKYIDSPDLVAGLVETVREMRHKAMSILVASQDPPSVPISLIELSDHIILHKFTSPAWLKHLQKANAALSSLSSDQMSRLQPGEAYVWASKATDPTCTHGAVRIRCRPRVTKHGGTTKTADNM